MSRLRLQLAAAAVFLLAWTQSSALEPRGESGVLPIDPPTPYIHYLNPAAGAAAPQRVLVVHGLDVSKEVMRLMSAALADGGFDVYAIDLPGHGDSVAHFRTEVAQQAIRNAKAYLGEKTIVVGHSLGAGLLLDLAATDQFSTVVLLSPPPISISEIHAERVLIATGAIDVPRILAFVPIASDIGGPRVESWILPWGAHSAPIFNPRYVRRVVEWLGGDGGKTRTIARMVWIVVMLASAVGLGVALLPGKPVPAVDIPLATALARYAAAFSVALFVLKVVNPLQWLGLFATDYLIGFFLVTGLCVCGIALRNTGTQKANGGWWKAVGAAAFVILVPGMLAGSHVLHMSLTDGRWWRFPCIALAGLPFFISDELMLRPMPSRRRSEIAALLTRGLLLAFLLTGVLTLNRENAFLVLIIPLLVIFWIALWFLAGVVHRHTQNAFAAALFSALVQGWAFAAWFVTIGNP